MARGSQLLGLFAVLTGFILVATNTPSPPLIDRYGYILVMVFSGIAILIGGSYILDQRDTSGEGWKPSDTEPGYRVPVPGDELESIREQELKNRLRRRTLLTLIESHGCSRSEAETHIENGTWTDDRLAAAYLSHGTVSIPLTTQLIGLLRSEPIKEGAVRRTVTALREIRGNND